MFRHPWAPYAFIAPAFIGLFVFRFIPIGLSGFGSFFSENLRGDMVFVGLKNYAELMDDP